ncbi:hypothetical protein GMLC_39000 [Geomonas limicola]|uniref:BioF2-like acetyltransferase domain-containing protein n=1 Tax=Geomonas limicola TaxID=2740186 RepID=A0A6V8NCS1_9BACT|nr:hypothetical protein [Geomonas limicola]GFO70321.1 hypothetical protein GMLC_39000 [Geomonas limicola]
MSWEPMTQDDLAGYQQACGVNVVKTRGIWWIEPRPYFFRTLYPLQLIPPQEASYPLPHLIGGVLHLVPNHCTGNTSMKLFLYDELKSYAPEKLPAKQKWVIKKSAENFQARRILDLDEFVETAYPIYASFYDRTRYTYKKERTQREIFASWGKTLFDYPKIMILGAYHQGELAAVDISYQVEDLVIDDVFFASTESQSLRVTDFMVHTLRELATTSSARYLFRGFPCGKKSLDESKINRGCKIFRIPAHQKINPLALHLGRLFMNESYRKLMTITSASYLDGHPTCEWQGAAQSEASEEVR